MAKRTKSDILKKEIILALEKTLGIVTTACKSAGVPRSTFYDWYRDDKEFKKQVDDIEHIAGDFVESALYKKIKEGDTSSIIFYCKTKLKHRGYIERQEVTGIDGAQLFKWNITPASGTTNK